MSFKYLQLDEVLHMHVALIERYGGFAWTQGPECAGECINAPTNRLLQ